MLFNIFCRRAFADIAKYFTAQFMTTMIVCLSVLLFTFFASFSYNLKCFVERFGNDLGLVVYLHKGIPQTEIPNIYQKITRLDGVEAVQFVSPVEAFKNLEKYLKNEKEILTGIEPDFLPASFEIRINRAVFNLEKIKHLARELTTWKEVSKVQYGQEWLDRLGVVAKIIQAIVYVAGIMLFLTSAFVVANTIKLTIFARQDEIEILRLVGATDGFIQGPFLIEAFIQGLLGSSIAVGVVFVAYQYIKNIISETDILYTVDLQFLPVPYVCAIIGTSVLLCVIGTAFSIRRFLRL